MVDAGSRRQWRWRRRIAAAVGSSVPASASRKLRSHGPSYSSYSYTHPNRPLRKPWQATRRCLQTGRPLLVAGGIDPAAAVLLRRSVANRAHAAGGEAPTINWAAILEAGLRRAAAIENREHVEYQCTVQTAASGVGHSRQPAEPAARRSELSRGPGPLTACSVHTAVTPPHLGIARHPETQRSSAADVGRRCVRPAAAGRCTVRSKEMGKADGDI